MISPGRIPGVSDVVDPAIDPVKLIDAAIAFAEGETGHYFGTPAETSDHLSGYDTPNLRLLSLPYSGASPLITGVTEQLAPGNAAVVLDPSEYEYRAKGHVAWLRRTGTGLWRAGYEYVVTYTHGYDFDRLPRDIEQLVMTLVQRRLGTFDTGGLKSETYDRVTLTRFTATDLIGIDSVDGIVSQWKVPVFA